MHFSILIPQKEKFNLKITSRVIKTKKEKLRKQISSHRGRDETASGIGGWKLSYIEGRRKRLHFSFNATNPYDDEFLPKEYPFVEDM